jgi:hypothetical protein
MTYHGHKRFSGTGIRTTFYDLVSLHYSVKSCPREPTRRWFDSAFAWEHPTDGQLFRHLPDSLAKYCHRHYIILSDADSISAPRAYSREHPSVLTTS